MDLCVVHLQLVCTVPLLTAFYYITQSFVTILIPLNVNNRIIQKNLSVTTVSLATINDHRHSLLSSESSLLQSELLWKFS